MMRSSLMRSLLALALAFGALGTLAGATSAAPAQQADFSILAVGFVDVLGGGDPACPACNGEYEAVDEDYAMANPLPELEFILRNTAGTEIDRQRTSPLAGFQRYTFTVPELMSGESYTLELASDPSGWQLCFNDSPSRVLTVDDFTINNAREDFRFYQGCDNITPTETPSGPTATFVPGQPTPTPRAGATNTPKSGGGSSGGARAPGERFVNRLGGIRGLAFIDLNANGVFEAGEPGLNDVGINLRGGGHEMFQITGPTGTFSWDGVGTGEYDLFIEPGPEWKITTPSKYKVKLNGGVSTGWNFGLIRFTDLPVGHPAPKHVTHDRIRLPSTGVADLPTSPLMAMLALVLGGLAVAGWSFERRKRED